MQLGMFGRGYRQRRRPEDIMPAAPAPDPRGDARLLRRILPDPPSQQEIESGIPPRGMFGSSAPKGGLFRHLGYRPEETDQGLLEWMWSDRAAVDAAKKGKASRAAQAEFNAMLDSMNLDPRERLAIELNPEKYGESLASNFEAANVNAGDSRYVNGKLIRAARNPMAVAEGTDVFDPDAGKSVYSNTPAPKPPEPYTLNPGDVRYDPNNRRVASAPPGASSAADRYRPASPAEIEAAGLPAGTSAQINLTTGKIDVLSDSRKAVVPASVLAQENKLLDEADSSAQAAADIAATMAQFNTLAKDWNSQGGGTWNDLGQALSMETSKLKALTDAMVPKMRQAGSGTMSDKDAEMYQNSVTNINNTREGNQLIAENAAAVAKRAQDHALFLRQWQVENPGKLSQGKLLWNQYKSAFPVFGPDGRATDPSRQPDPFAWASQQTEAATQNDPAQASGVPTITSAAERDALPPGTQYRAPDGKMYVKK